MTTMEQTTETIQVYRVYIRATPEAIWTAITDPDWTERFGYGGRGEYDLRPGGAYRGWTSQEMREHGAPELGVDGEVIECDAPHRLVQTWRMVMDEGMTAQGFTRLTYDIEPGAGDVTKLTVTHDLTGAPRLAALMNGELEDQGAGGGWAWVLSSLKTLLETGESIRP
jgi:uncharacterized protein YndB with AHSA1/START domain